MPKSKQITEWSDAQEIIKSGYGEITYREWCEREKERIGRHGTTVRIIKRKGGLIALSR